MALSPLDAVAQTLQRRVNHTVSDASLMPAAVMILLYPKDGEFCVLLNKRSQEVEHHKGEISFPGGARDPEDRDFLDTALRETEEEMGIARGDITLLGRLDDIVTRTDFSVAVFVGTIPYPYAFHPSPIEIAEVLEVPVSALLDPANHRYETRLDGAQLETVVSYAHGEHLVFGATARILDQFLETAGEGLTSGLT